MKILIPREWAAGEKRVAVTPETVRRLQGRQINIEVERGAGVAAGYPDDLYNAIGASVVDSEALDWSGADGVLCVQPPAPDALARMRQGSLLVGLLAPHGAQELTQLLNNRSISSIALELLPRISRAQSMDVLSSQANIAGYKAVLLAAAELDRYVPMLMTAAGTIQPARVLILGAGVAGLQALATARRLGGVVYVSDVRAAAKEQVESLGGRFLDPPSEQDLPSEKGGYATQASETFLAAQRKQLSEQLALADMVICTAQVPGRPAPRLISEDMLDRMRPGSVVVDLAVAQGGNCAGTVPGETVIRSGVRLIGAEALPSSVPNHASALYARNVAALMEHLVHEEGGLRLDLDDPIVEACLLTHAGACRRDDVVQTAPPPIPAGTVS
ncbi:MAG: Re/Si-specific NAD(P)(+) transhydrogenase subunit alpha [Cyanobium sp.]|nr:Re/Si-specific NAD(P)(+) transhydrogenase subunit alpha [Cyanobacteriota bacterium]